MPALNPAAPEKCLRCMRQRQKIKALWLAPDRKRR